MARDPALEAAYMRVFKRQFKRLRGMTPEACRTAEVALLEEFFNLRSDAPGLGRLIQEIRAEEPTRKALERSLETMKSLFSLMYATNQTVDVFERVLTGYLDGRAEVGSEWFTADVLPRNWS